MRDTIISVKEMLAKYSITIVFIGYMIFSYLVSTLGYEKSLQLDKKFYAVCDSCNDPVQESKCQLAKEIMKESRTSISDFERTVRWYGFAFVGVAGFLLSLVMTSNKRNTK